MNTYYEDTCDVKCNDNDMNVKAEVLDFKRGYMLTVSINRQIKLNLRYNTGTKMYVGSKAGMEFSSFGPKNI